MQFVVKVYEYLNNRVTTVCSMKIQREVYSTLHLVPFMLVKNNDSLCASGITKLKRRRL